MLDCQSYIYELMSICINLDTSSWSNENLSSSEVLVELKKYFSLNWVENMEKQSIIISY